RPPSDDGAFFALRSCHQQLGGDSGEFFSPDYLCSNPPLWCNWTIRVDPTKRVHLDLEDLTPADACHVKQDQLHVEDPAGGHKLLLKCWRETKFTSSTNMLEVVLLIGGWPSVPYRGFYGRYQAFGPPVVYDPEEIPQDEGEGEEESANGHNHSPSPLPLPQEESETDQSDSEPNVMEPQSERRGNCKNFLSLLIHFQTDRSVCWLCRLHCPCLPKESNGRSTILSCQQQLSSLTHACVYRLNAGALFILWVQLSQEPGDLKVHGVIHATLQGLIATDVIENVNECGTQLVLCDVNADCVNWFGSYSCRCRPGFRDVSRLGSGGTVCIDMTSTGFGSGLAAETKGVYVLFFLLSSLVLMLLAAAGLLYHRHRRGAFQVHCQSTGNVSDPNNNRHRDNCGPAELPPLPPPPPARGLRESWPRVKECCPAVELPLLRFSPLMMEGYKEPQERGKI
uniref:Uncharacterized LOC101078859 n=1 Tax=Takifugu rubripes TaxID=31033 RepID=A0A674PQQ0_TAKRU